MRISQGVGKRQNKKKLAPKKNVHSGKLNIPEFVCKFDIIETIDYKPTRSVFLLHVQWPQALHVQKYFWNCCKNKSKGIRTDRVREDRTLEWNRKQTWIPSNAHCVTTMKVRWKCAHSTEKRTHAWAKNHCGENLQKRCSANANTLCQVIMLIW